MSSLTARYWDNVKFGSETHPIQVKRRKGSYSLHNQIVLLQNAEIALSCKIVYIHTLKDGTVVGFVRCATAERSHKTFYDFHVKRFGKRGWQYINL